MLDNDSAGLLFSQMWYWSTEVAFAPCSPQCRLCSSGDTSWRWKPDEQMGRDLHQSIRTLRTGRGRIKELDIAEFERAGEKGIRHWRIKMEKLIPLLHGQAQSRRLLELIEIHRRRLEESASQHYDRARKLGRKAERFSYVEIHVRERGLCYLCRQEVTSGPGQRGDHLQFHHVLALEDGGDHVPENLKPVHAACHQGHHLKTRLAKSQVSPELQNDNSQLAESQVQSCAFGTFLIKETKQRVDRENPPTPFVENSEALVLTPGPPIFAEAPSPETSADPRFLVVMDAIKKISPLGLKGWGPPDDDELHRLLAEHPNLSGEDLAVAVFFYFQSTNINSALQPRDWLETLPRYVLGPLTGYGSAARDVLQTPHERQQARANALRVLYGDQASLQYGSGCALHPRSGLTDHGQCYGCYSDDPPRRSPVSAPGDKEGQRADR